MYILFTFETLYPTCFSCPYILHVFLVHNSYEFCLPSIELLGIFCFIGLLHFTCGSVHLCLFPKLPIFISYCASDENKTEIEENRTVLEILLICE